MADINVHVPERAPRRFSDPGTKDFLEPDACKALFQKIESMTTGGGETTVYLSVRWNGTAKWARSQMQMAAENNDVYLQVNRVVRGARGKKPACTNQLDDAGLLEVIQHAERAVREDAEFPEGDVRQPVEQSTMLRPVLWSDSTYALSAERRTDLARTIMEPAESRGLLSAGRLEIAAQGQAFMDSHGQFRYYPITDVQCSVTVRNKQGTGSGWAGQHNYDFAKLDLRAIAERSLDKCLRSSNPVAVEPGRYTTILEPQAVADLFSPVLERHDEESPEFVRPVAESGEGPFASNKRKGYSKIGEQVLDKRFTVSSDPMDPDAGFVPFSPGGSVYKPVNWIDKGILRELSYSDEYALSSMGLPNGLGNPKSYRLKAEGPTTSIEDMIKTTARGLLVTRFSGVQMMERKSALLSGFTRDGLWLIENGKISKPAKNFRFTESPMFVLNKVEAIGPHTRVFTPPFARIAPALKVLDFSFTSLADAV